MDLPHLELVIFASLKQFLLKEIINILITNSILDVRK